LFIAAKWALAATVFALPRLASADSPREEQGYVRLCSYWQDKSESEAAAILKRSNESVAALEAKLPQKARYLPPTDAQIVEAARGALAKGGVGLPDASSVTAVSVAVRNLANYESQLPGWPQGPGEKAVVRVDTRGGIVRLLLDIDSKGTLRSATVIGPERLYRAYMFVRGMAAYILFNELMASDSVVPRRGCAIYARYTDVQLPELLPEIERAAETVPEQDAVQLSRARAAYDAYSFEAQALPGSEGALTRETLSKVGQRPEMTIVYRDADQFLGSRGEILVVKVGDAVHTYFTVYTSPIGGTSMTPTPLCLQGDIRCATYYGWP
jgi:hypothetical protein